MSRPLYCNTVFRLCIQLIKYLQVEFNPQRVNLYETFIVKINVRRLQGIYDNSFVLVSVFLTHFFSQLNHAYSFIKHQYSLVIGMLHVFSHSFIAFFICSI